MLEQINNDLKQAMKDKDKFKLDVIRMLKSALQMESIAKKKELTDEEILSVIKREVKKRKSSIEEYEKYNKLEVVESLNKEIVILNKYLPEEISDDELNKVIDETIKEVGAESIKQMGVVIKTINSKVGTRADMSKVSKIVKEKLNS